MAKTSEKKLKKLRASQKSASTKAATAKSIAKAESKKSSSSSSSSKTTTKSRDEQIADIKAAAEKLQRDLEEGIRKGTIKSSKEIAEKEEKIKEKLQEAGEEYEYDAGELESSQEFQDLPEDEQEVVRNVFKAIAENNKVAADQLVAAFEAATSYANPYFKQKLRLAKDELERGFVAIDQEQEFKLERMNKRLADLKEDVAAKREFLTLEEAADLKEIERTYMQEQQTLRQNLAATGMSSSTRRVDM